MSEGGYDMKTLIHVGAEFVMATCLFVWTNKQISKVNDRLENTEIRFAKMEEQMRMQGAVIVELERIITGGSMRYPHRHDHKISSSENRSSKVVEQGFSRVDQNPQISIKKEAQTQYPVEEIKQIDETIEEPNPDVLDSILQKELSEINKMRKKGKKKKPQEEIEIIFEDPDGSYLDDGILKKK